MSEIVQELTQRGLSSTGSRKLAAARLCKATKAANPPVKKTKETKVKVDKVDKVVKQKTKEIKVKVKVKADSPLVKKTTGTKAKGYASVLPYDRYVSDHTDQFKIISKYDPKRRIINLSGPVLRQFSNFVKAGIEFGGMIDINKDGSFDRAMFGIGMKRSVRIDDMLDFEVIFHTHPSGRTMFAFEQPSKSDIQVSMFASTIEYADRITPKHQVHVVFTPEGVYTIYVPNTKIDYRNPSIIEDVLGAFGLLPALTKRKEVIDITIERLAQLGIYVFRYSKVSRLKDVDQEEPINNWLDSIPLYIDPQEPVIDVRKRGFRNSLTPQDRQTQQLKDTLQRAQDKQESERVKLIWIQDEKDRAKYGFV